MKNLKHAIARHILDGVIDYVDLESIDKDYLIRIVRENEGRQMASKTAELQIYGLWIEIQEILK